MISLKTLNNIFSTPSFTSKRKNEKTSMGCKNPSLHTSFSQKNDLNAYGVNVAAANNLAPLKADTVSFTGKTQLIENTDASKASNASKVINMFPCNPQDAAEKRSISQARREARERNALYNNAHKTMNPAAYGLYKEMLPIASDIHFQLKKYEDVFNIKMCIFDCLLNDSGKKSKKGPLASKTGRIKSAQSIAKKLSVKVADMNTSIDRKNTKVLQAIAKSEMHDFFGTRLILNHGSVAETNAVINQLIKSIESGNGPKIKTIKNYGKDHKYLTNNKLEDLEKAITGAGYTYPEVINQRKSSGYTATHIIFEVGGGFDGEIQILGRGVHRVKEVDDICYKGLQGKAIKGLPEISRELKKIGKDPEKTLEYNEYLTKAYDLAKKEWDKMPDGELYAQRFPAIDTNKFPSCLDLNNIERAIMEASHN